MHSCYLQRKATLSQVVRVRKKGVRAPAPPLYIVIVNWFSAIYRWLQASQTVETTEN